MTQDEIKNNAEAYADAYCGRDDQNGMWQECCNIFIAGAHSREEEIKSLKLLITEKTDEVAVAVAEKVLIKQELKLLRKPWHKASDELPPISEPREESADCLLAVIGSQVKVGGKMYLTGFYDHEVRDWHIYGTGYSQLTNIMVLEWQLIQKQ